MGTGLGSSYEEQLALILKIERETGAKNWNLEHGIKNLHFGGDSLS